MTWPLRNGEELVVPPSIVHALRGSVGENEFRAGEQGSRSNYAKVELRRSLPAFTSFLVRQMFGHMGSVVEL